MAYPIRVDDMLRGCLKELNRVMDEPLDDPKSFAVWLEKDFAANLTVVHKIEPHSPGSRYKNPPWVIVTAKDELDAFKFISEFIAGKITH